MPFRQTVFPATVFRINIFVDNDLQYTARLELLLIDCDGLMKLSSFCSYELSSLEQCRHYATSHNVQLNIFFNSP